MPLIYILYARINRERKRERERGREGEEEIENGARREKWRQKRNSPHLSRRERLIAPSAPSLMIIASGSLNFSRGLIHAALTHTDLRSYTRDRETREAREARDGISSRDFPISLGSVKPSGILSAESRPARKLDHFAGSLSSRPRRIHSRRLHNRSR